MFVVLRKIRKYSWVIVGEIDRVFKAFKVNADLMIAMDRRTNTGKI